MAEVTKLYSGHRKSIGQYGSDKSILANTKITSAGCSLHREKDIFLWSSFLQVTRADT